MNKKIYHTPAIRTMLLQQQYHLLAGSGQAPAGPSANYMSNPGISDDEEIGDVIY